jgi:hypothetical protein
MLSAQVGKPTCDGSPKCGSHLRVTVTERDGFTLGLKHSRDKLEACKF